jgi:hypothetical protein
MSRTVLAGIVGGVLGVLPLALLNLIVNASGALGAFETQAASNAAQLGALALLGGLALGGSVAGWMAGRRGLVPAAVAGGIAALLYAVCVILLVVGGAKAGWGPPIAALHPLRASAAILLVASLLALVALGVGWLTARRAAAAHAMARRATGAQPGVGRPGSPASAGDPARAMERPAPRAQR